MIAIGKSREGSMAGLRYEQFEVGMVFDHEWSRTVTEADNVMFSTMTMNPQPLHLDAHFAATTEFHRPLVNSLFTLGLMIGMSVNDTTLGTTIANLGMSDVRFPKPVFQGDTLKVRTTVEDMRTSNSRPDAGIVSFLHSAYNQNGDEVAICKRAALMRRMDKEEAG
ncbi:MaoC family dehydratase [Aquisalimonas lutea]|uniref:MaoC family dehydratase n=1 Tax=Aquisalimonas lutea TaxID=1327750 RepID=UPI0025B43CE5|nr:MaoC family dehydratase [Aquisalimonas lutea]MDN3519712.1 MaoC family dehydratase [Aquisalimonas lutea]